MSDYIVRETVRPGFVKQEKIGELVTCKYCKHCDIYEDNFTSSCKLGNLMDNIYGYCSDAEWRMADEILRSRNTKE